MQPVIIHITCMLDKLTSGASAPLPFTGCDAILPKCTPGLCLINVAYFCNFQIVAFLVYFNVTYA